MKKTCAIIYFLFAGLLPLSGVSFAKDFTDVPEQHSHYRAIKYFELQGVFRGKDNGGNFNPGEIINRAEWAELLVRQSGNQPTLSDYGDCFYDIYDEWYAPSVCFAAAKGWIKGYQSGSEYGFFMPVNGLNVSEILVTLSRVFDWQISPTGSWYSGALEHAKKANIISSTTTFDQPVTRAQAAEIFFRALTVQEFKVSRYEPFLADLMLPVGTPAEVDPATSNVIDDTTVTLTKFTEQPAKSTLAQGSLYVPVLRFLLETTKDANLREISVKRISLGATDDLAAGRLLINGRTLKESSFSTTENAVFWRNLNYTIRAGEPAIVEMNIDLVENSRSNYYYQFETEPSRIIFNNENVRGEGIKVIGKEFKTSTIPADSITIKLPKNALRLPFVESLDQTVARFIIRAGEHDGVLRRIRLEDAGDISDKDYKNFRLSAGGEIISTLDSAAKNILDFVINDFPIEAGKDRTFTVIADILGARKADNIRFYLANPQDINFFDLEYGFGARVTNQFGLPEAWCVGSNTAICPAEGLRKHCSKEDRENNVTDC